MKPLERIRAVLTQLEHESVGHLNEWLEEHPRDGTGDPESERAALLFREQCLRAFSENRGTWRALAMDRLMAAFSEGGRRQLRDGLLDAAGLLVAWIVALEDRPESAVACPECHGTGSLLPRGWDGRDLPPGPECEACGGSGQRSAFEAREAG